MPLIEARVNWPKGESRKGFEFSLAEPDLTITYTDSDGDSQTLTEATGVTIHSARHGCGNG